MSATVPTNDWFDEGFLTYSQSAARKCDKYLKTLLLVVVYTYGTTSKSVLEYVPRYTNQGHYLKDTNEPH